ncbi:MAG: glycoside hydrolase family 2 TIM barrel-domain containing protein [Bryobacteraceae bacterium]
MPLFLLLLAATVSAQTLPRPEYPEPRFERPLWQSLNGSWEFDFDNENRGVEQGWPSGKKSLPRRIAVPFCPESKQSGIGDTGFHPWVWYRRSFDIPAAWSGKRTLLHFGAVDYRAWVWVNGQLAGSHTGGNTPFRFDITPLLTPGSNTVVVRAEDPPTDRTIPRGKQFWLPKSRGIFYTRTTGIWQPVWLEAVGDAYFDRVRANASMDGEARFEARLARYAPGLQFSVTIRDGDRVAASATVPADDPATFVDLRVRNPRLWYVNQPNLYDVTYEVRRGDTVLDTVNSYIGFRTVSVGGGRVLINGRPTYIKMLLDQGYWPDSLLTPPSDDAIRFDIKASMDMGFNGVRKHQKLEDPRFLYWADKMGFLVSDEMANAYEYDADYAARFTREWIETVERDVSHPSVIMWVPINESWGVPNLADSAQQAHLKALYWLTKSLDPTRPVIDNDGWEHVDTMDLFTIHDYTGTGPAFYEKYKDLGKPAASVPNNGRAIFAPGYSYNGTPFLLSEFGGIAYVPEGARVPGGAWGYAGTEKSADSAMARLTGLYQAIARIPAIAGICYTQITDVEQEVNGLMTYDRKLKFDPAKVKELNDLLR